MVRCSKFGRVIIALFVGLIYSDFREFEIELKFAKFTFRIFDHVDHANLI